jgi:hypothetical protein
VAVRTSLPWSPSTLGSCVAFGQSAGALKSQVDPLLLDDEDEDDDALVDDELDEVVAPDELDDDVVSLTTPSPPAPPPKPPAPLVSSWLPWAQAADTAATAAASKTRRERMLAIVRRAPGGATTRLVPRVADGEAFRRRSAARRSRARAA